MNKKNILLNEALKLLEGRSEDEKCVYEALSDRFYRISDVDLSNGFKPKPNARGYKNERKMMTGQYYSLKNGIDIYF